VVAVNTEKLSNEMITELRKKAKGNLYTFAKGVLGFDFIDPIVHLPLCRVLELYDGYNDTLEAPRVEYEVVLRELILRHCRMHSLIWSEDVIKDRIEDALVRGIKQCKFTLPRGWLKTTMCSIAYPLWRGVRDSNVRVLLVQNTYTNACAKLQSIKGLVEGNVLFRELFKDVLPTAKSKWKGDSLCLTRKGAFAESTFEAAGVRTQVTSRHYDLIIEDDTVAPENDDVTEDIACPSMEDIAKAIGWHKLTTPLLVDPGKGQNMVVGTRWAERDLLSYVDEKEHHYWSVERACRENDQGLEDVKGKSCYESRFPERVLTQIESTMGPYMFAALYRNKPMNSTDMVFKPDWITYYDTPPRGLMVYTMVDLATDPETAKGARIDYNVVETTGKDLQSGHVYVLDVWRKKCSPMEVINELFRQHELWSPIRTGCESIAYQSTMLYWIKEIQQQRKVFFHVEAITHGRRSKGDRIMGLQPLFASLQIHVRRHHSALVNELMSFPRGENDDIIDTLSMHLKFWRNTISQSDVKQQRLRDNPLSLDFALEQLHKRSEPKKGFPFDVQRVNEVPILGFSGR